MSKKNNKGKWFSKQALIEFIDESPEDLAFEQESYLDESDSSELLEKFQKNEEKPMVMKQTAEQLSDEKKEPFDKKDKHSINNEEVILSDEHPTVKELKNALVLEKEQREAEKEKNTAEKIRLQEETSALEETLRTQQEQIEQLLKEKTVWQQQEDTTTSANQNDDQRLMEEDFLEVADKLSNTQNAKKLSEQELKRVQSVVIDQELALERQKTAYEDQLASKEIELREVTNDKKRMEKTLEDTQQVTKKIKAMNLSLKKENDVLLDKLQQLEENLQEQAKDNVAFTNLQEKYEELNNQYEQAQKETTGIQKKYQESIDENEKEQQKYADQLSKLKEKIIKLEELEKKCTRLEEENKQWVENGKEMARVSNQKMEDIQMALAEKEKQNNQMTVELEELKAVSEEKEALNSALFDAHEEISKLEEQLKEAAAIRLEKEELATQLEESARALTQLSAEAKNKDGKEDSEELTRAKRQITELVDKNEALKKEVIQSQQEIGEVLISAKKQANRTVEEAKIEAKHMISSAELELENISNRAKKIYIEASESKDNVLEIYEELLLKIDQLSKGALLKERLKDIEPEPNN